MSDIHPCAIESKSPQKTAIHDGYKLCTLSRSGVRKMHKLICTRVSVQIRWLVVKSNTPFMSGIQQVKRSKRASDKIVVSTLNEVVPHEPDTASLSLLFPISNLIGSHVHIDKDACAICDVESEPKGCQYPIHILNR